MTNLVAITVKATDSSDYAAIRASAAKAGADAADEFNRAFKLRADASGSASERIKETGGAGGRDDALMARLRQYASTPGGIGILGTGSDTSLLSALKSKIMSGGSDMGLLSGTNAPGTSTTDMVREVLTNSVTGSTSSTDFIKQVLEGAAPSNVSTSDVIKQVLTGSAPGNVTTSDIIKQVLEGAGPKDTTTTDLVKVVADKASEGSIFSGLSTDASKSGKDIGGSLMDGVDSGMNDRRGSFSSWVHDIGSDLLNAFHDFFGIHSPATSTIPIGQGLMQGIQSGMSSASSALLTSAKDIGSKLLGALTPSKSSAAGAGSLLTGSAGGAGGVAGVLDTGGAVGGALPGIAGVSGMAATVTGLAAALVAVLPAITSVVGGLAAIGGGFAILEVTDKQFAADMKSTLGDLESVFSAAAMPLAKPLEEAATQIAGYFKQIEPDLKAVFADSAPLIQPLVKGFEDLMSGAGPGFLAMIKAAGPVFQSVSGAFAGLGKALGEMFQDFASDGKGSATILTGFLGIINSLLPFIGELGKVLVSALAPAFTAFSSALSGVLPALTPLMSILGSFAGAVLTDLGSVLGAVGQLLVGLAPSFTSLATVASNLFNTLENAGVFAVLGDVLENLAKPLAGLINALVKGLAPALPPIISAVGQVATLLAGQLGAALGDILTALTPVIAFVAKLVAGLVTWLSQNHLLIPVLILIAGAIDPVGTSIALVGLAISELVTHWSAIWGEIKSIAADVGTYLDNLFHNKIVQDILAVWSAGLIPLAEHWTTVWGAIENTAKSIWNAISGFFVSAYNNLVSTAKTAWDNFSSAVSNGISTAVKFVSGLPGKFVSGLASLGNDLLGVGKTAFNDFLSGIESIGSTILSWVKNFASSVINAIKSILGIGSPSRVMYEVGQNLMRGLQGGIEAAANAAANTAKTAAENVAKAAASGAKAAASAAASAASGGSVEALMKSMAAARGWTGVQWTDLYNVEMAEAGFDLTATNPSSGAYGLAQFIGGPAEYAQYGGNSTTAAGQITGMLNYIADRYGSPAGAWAHEEAYGWYDQGGWLPPGRSIAVNNTGAPERVIGPGGINVSLEIGSSGNTAFDALMMQWFREKVRIKGGGSVQKAFGYGSG